jgi:hypothetical protein
MSRRLSGLIHSGHAWRMNHFNKGDSRSHEGDQELWPRSVALLVRQVIFALREAEKGGWAHLGQIAGARTALEKEYQRQRPDDTEFNPDLKN